MSGKSNAVNVIFLGTAGSGKTTMVYRFGEWLERVRNYDVRYINLDPGCRETPFGADFDIRSFFSVEDIMRKEKLGPNAAMVRCSDLMAEKSDAIAKAVSKLDGSFRLFDIAGQMEVFVFRESGPAVARSLNASGYTTSVMLFDSALTCTPMDVAIAQLMSLVVRLRIGIPMITAISKADIQSTPDIVAVLSDQSKLAEAIEKYGRGQGTARDLSLEVTSIIRDFRWPARIVRTSAITGEGFDELLDIIGETTCECGDLT